MRKLILVGIVLTGLNGCAVDKDPAIRILKSQGFTDIQTTGYRWISCGPYNTGFRASGMDGSAVEGTVCWNWSHGYTVRFD